jgi:hypothetical protein
MSNPESARFDLHQPEITRSSANHQLLILPHQASLSELCGTGTITAPHEQEI